MKLKLLSVLGVLAMCLAVLAPQAARADTDPGGGGSTKTADCHAYVESLERSGYYVAAKFMVSCNVLVNRISVNGGLQQGNHQVQRQKDCWGVASCTFTLSLSNPSGSQAFAAMFAWDGTFVAWPNFLPATFHFDSSSSKDCPDMGCRMVQKSF